MRKQAGGTRGARAPTRRARSAGVQYTVREVPAHIDRALRHRASEQGKSLNQVLREALIKEAGGTPPRRSSTTTSMLSLERGTTIQSSIGRLPSRTASMRRCGDEDGHRYESLRRFRAR